MCKKKQLYNNVSYFGGGLIMVFTASKSPLLRYILDNCNAMKPSSCKSFEAAFTTTSKICCRDLSPTELLVEVTRKNKIFRE